MFRGLDERIGRRVWKVAVLDWGRLLRGLLAGCGALRTAGRRKIRHRNDRATRLCVAREIAVVDVRFIDAGRRENESVPVRYRWWQRKDSERLRFDVLRFNKLLQARGCSVVSEVRSADVQDRQN